MSETLKEKINSILVSGKYSELFYNQFLYLVKSGKMDFDFIAREIEYLEGKRADTSTKKEAMFLGEVLSGLWHKHIWNAHNIPRNIMNLLNKEFPAISKNSKNDEEFLEKILALIPKSVASKKKTGDWIVYQKNESGNLYLTIAAHNETDIEIYNRIKKYLHDNDNIKN